jgi:hydrogenase expression/formation protein HypD
MSIYQYGLRQLMPSSVRLVSGPGCPVCVTETGFIDAAIALGLQRDFIIATFGDLMRVPGSLYSLLEARAQGADVRVVYSPLDALSLASSNTASEVIFLGIGFETTTPGVAAAITAAASKGLRNFSVLSAHKTMPEAMALISSNQHLRVDGYLCPPHVSVVIGADAYSPLVENHRIPCVITGFEPADILQGIEMALLQILEQKPAVQIQYSRAVTKEGNCRARDVMQRVFEPSDSIWRGLGSIVNSGLAIRDLFKQFDASYRFNVTYPKNREPEGCRCGEILTGAVSPFDCPLFAATCTPESPVGGCMVSSEGTCAAAFKYGIP